MVEQRERATELATELRRELGRIEGLTQSEHHALRSVVSEYVAELRSLDWPPERVIKMIKQIAQDEGLGPRKRDIPATAWTARDRLLFDLVNWSITEYYKS
jgi:hypothetical protein